MKIEIGISTKLKEVGIFCSDFFNTLASRPIYDNGHRVETKANLNHIAILTNGLVAKETEYGYYMPEGYYWNCLDEDSDKVSVYDHVYSSLGDDKWFHRIAYTEVTCEDGFPIIMCIHYAKANGSLTLYDFWRVHSDGCETPSKDEVYGMIEILEKNHPLPSIEEKYIAKGDYWKKTNPHKLQK